MDLFESLKNKLQAYIFVMLYWCLQNTLGEKKLYFYVNLPSRD